jgi:hypothetical protein
MVKPGGFLLRRVLSARQLTFSIALYAVATPVVAADLSLRLNASEGLEFNDNIGATSINKDAAVVSTTSVGLDILARSKTYLLRLSPGVTARRNFFANSSSDFDIFPTLTADFSGSRKLTSYGLAASISQSNINSSELIPGLGLFTVNGSQFVSTASASLGQRLTRIDSVSWSAGITDTNYNVTSIVPSRAFRSNTVYNTNVGWKRDWTQLIATNLSASLSYYDPYDNGPTRVTFEPNAKLDAKLTKRLSATLGAGLSISKPENGDTSTSLVFNTGANYNLSKDTVVSASFNSGVSAAQNGTLFDRYSFETNVKHQVNDLLSVSLATIYSIKPIENGPDTTAFSFAPAINYQLARDWNSSLSYQFSRSSENDNPIYSNSVFLNVTYGLTLLP